MTESPRFTLLLMGAFGLRACGQSSNFTIAAKKARALLAYVAMQEAMRCSRERLATLFWPDRTDRMARQNLRACIATLRRDLAALADDVLIADEETIGLSDAVIVDARRLRSLPESGETARLEEAAALYRGQFLADLALDGEAFCEWASAERAKLDAAAGAVLAKLASRAAAAGDGAKAIELSSRLIAIDPFREDWLRLGLSISAHHLGRDKALQQARSFVALLKKELDVAPDAETVELIARIKAGNVRQAPDRNVRAQSASREPPARLPAAPDHRRRAIAATIVAAAAVAVACLAAVYRPDFGNSRWWWPGTIGHAVAARSTIPFAVLPFESETADTAEFSRGLTGNVVAKLSRFSGVTVLDASAAPIAPTGSSGWPDAAAARFQAWGAVHRRGALIAVNVGLTDAADRMVVWTDDYAMPQEPAADLTEKLSRRLARAFQVQATYALARGLDETKLSSAPINQLIAKALTIQYRSPAPDEDAAAAALYQEVLRRDRGNPYALIGMAARLVQSSLNLLSAREPALGRAEALLKAALRADPHVERAYYWLGNMYLARGQRELALQSLARALELNPSFIPAEAHAAFALVLSGRADEGLRRLEDALAEDARDPSERVWLVFAAVARLELGEDQAAIKSLLQAASLAAPAPPLRAVLASAYALTGDRTKSREQFRLMKQTADPAALEQLLARAAKSDNRQGVVQGSGQGSRYLHGLRLAANDAP